MKIQDPPPYTLAPSNLYTYALAREHNYISTCCFHFGLRLGYEWVVEGGRETRGNSWELGGLLVADGDEGAEGKWFVNLVQA